MLVALGRRPHVPRTRRTMTVEKIRTAWKERPFRPFVLHLADGRQVPVRHPEFMLISPLGRTIVVEQPDDTMNIVDVFLVTDIEYRRRGSRSRPRR
jgi:hypothetical protein